MTVMTQYHFVKEFAIRILHMYSSECVNFEGKQYLFIPYYRTLYAIGLNVLIILYRAILPQSVVQIGSLLTY